MFPGGNCSSRLRFYARRAASGFGGAFRIGLAGDAGLAVVRGRAPSCGVWPPETSFFWGGNPACRWKNGGKGGSVRSAPLSGERAFLARYFSGYGLPLPPRPLRRAVFSAQCVLAHDAHPPRPLPLKKHHIRRSTTAATTMPIPQTAKSCHLMSEPHEKAVDRPCYDPRQHRVVGHGSRGPFPPGLGADGGDGRNAGEVEEDEYQES